MLVLKCLALIGAVVVTLTLLSCADGRWSARSATGYYVEALRFATTALVRWVVECASAAGSVASGAMGSAVTAGTRGGEDDEW